jgi:hypothetical protein
MRPHYVVRTLATAAVAVSLGAPAAQARFLVYYPTYAPVHHAPVHHPTGEKHRGHPRVRTTGGVAV